MSADFKITGGKELDAALASLTAVGASAALADGVRAGAILIRDEARRRAPKHAGPYEGKQKNQRRPGTLRRGISVRVIRRISQGYVEAKIGWTKRAWYGRLVEMGHRIVGRLPKGDGVRGSAASKARRAARKAAHALGRMVAPRPHLRPAFDQMAPKAVEAMGAGAWQGILKQIGKGRVPGRVR